MTETNSQKNAEARPDDVNQLGSTKKGIEGLIENAFRKFRDLGFIVFLAPIVLLCMFCLAVSLTPGVYLFLKVLEFVKIHGYSEILMAFVCSFSIAIGIGLFMVTLIFIVPLVNLPLLPFVKPYRGPWFSIESVAWYYHNALTYLVRYTILEFFTPSPLNILFFKMMGMKIGKGVMINSSNISDPCLIVLDDYVTIGGSAFLMAHYGMKGFLIIDKLHIKKGAMIGLGAKILGGVTIGEKATVLPNSAVLPKTIIKDHEKFGVSSQVI
jgi:hypothetical protein